MGVSGPEQLTLGGLNDILSELLDFAAKNEISVKDVQIKPDPAE